MGRLLNMMAGVHECKAKKHKSSLNVGNWHKGHSSEQWERTDWVPLCWGQSRNSYLLVTWLWNKKGFFSFSGFYSHTVFQIWFSVSMLVTSAVQGPLGLPAAQHWAGISFPTTWVDYFRLGKLVGICQLVKWYKWAGYRSFLESYIDCVSLVTLSGSYV